jgi:hypothetical protein
VLLSVAAWQSGQNCADSSASQTPLLLHCTQEKRHQFPAPGPSIDYPPLQVCKWPEIAHLELQPRTAPKGHGSDDMGIPAGSAAASVA